MVVVIVVQEIRRKKMRTRGESRDLQLVIVAQRGQMEVTLGRLGLEGESTRTQVVASIKIAKKS